MTIKANWRMPGSSVAGIWPPLVGLLVAGMAEIGVVAPVPRVCVAVGCEPLILPGRNRLVWLNRLFGPESRQENRLRKAANGLEIVVEKGAIVGEVIQDCMPRPIRKPGTIDNEGRRERPNHLSPNN